MAKLIGCEISFIRSKGNQILKIRVLPEIEALFKEESENISKNYKDATGNGLDYYDLSPKLSKYVQQYNSRLLIGKRITLDRYGGDLILDGYYNYSILRTVKISEGIELNIAGLILDEEIEPYYRSLANLTKYIYQNFIEPREIKATMTIEV